MDGRRHGVDVVWLLEPRARIAYVIEDVVERAFGVGATLEERPSLPGLAPLVEDLFRPLR